MKKILKFQSVCKLGIQQTKVDAVINHRTNQEQLVNLGLADPNTYISYNCKITKQCTDQLRKISNTSMVCEFKWEPNP
jgi:hypothetical protein